MSDIRLIIEEAADVLTRNERKQKSKKQDYTTIELEDMLKLQEIEKDKNRTALNQKLVALCEKAKGQFNLSSIPMNMMQKIAIDVYNEIKNGNITSVEAVEKNTAVTKTIQREATKVQLIENYEAVLDGRSPIHANVPYYSEEAKIIVSMPVVASKLNEMNEITPTDDKVSGMLAGLNVENADEIADSIFDVMSSEEYKEQEISRAKAAGEGVLATKEPEEQRIFCEDIDHEEMSVRCRLDLTDEDNLRNLMFNYLTRLSMKNVPADRVLADINMNLLSNKLLTPEQRVQLNEYSRNKDLRSIFEFLSERIVELNPNVSKEEVEKQAKAAAAATIDPSRIDKSFLKSQARIMYRDDRQFVEYCDLANSIYALSNDQSDLDWEKIAEVKAEAYDLYSMTLAALNSQTRKVDDKSSFEKVQVLVEEYVEENKAAVREDALFVRIESAEKTSSESMYWAFANIASHASNDLENVKRARINNIRSSNLFTEEERQEEIRRVEQIQTVEDVVNYSVEGIAREKAKMGQNIDAEKVRAQLVPSKELTPREKYRETQIQENAKINARAKATTINPEYYKRFIQERQTLAHVRKDEEIHIDEELLDYLREYDSPTYDELCAAYSGSSNVSLRNEIEKRVKSEKRQERLQEMKLAKQKSASEIKGIITEVTDENTLMDVAGSTQRTKIQDSDELEL